MWCRRNDGDYVVETTADDPTGKYHPDFIWYDCPDDVEVSDWWNGSAYVKPVKMEEADNIPPPDEEGVCTIRWRYFEGTYAGWGFDADFTRPDITALGLKVYDENGAYLYALTFQASDYPGQWHTETPAGFATSTKIERQFEIIAGSAPVTPKESLTAADEYRSLYVTWQPE